MRQSKSPHLEQITIKLILFKKKKKEKLVGYLLGCYVNTHEILQPYSKISEVSDKKLIQ